MTDQTWTLYLLAQFPSALLLFLYFFRSRFGTAGRPDREELAAEKAGFEKLKARHAELKKSVANEEKEENRSFQIYGLAKGLAETLSWADMAPRLTSGVQKVFDAHEFLLYGIDSGNKWTMLHRRGGWAQEPPFSGALPQAPALFRPPQTQEVVPVLFVPIFANDQAGRAMNGALFLKVHPDKNEGDLVTAGGEFGEELGMALNKAILFSQMETHSRVDGLTGLLRRQPFMDRLNEELKKAKAFQTPFCVIMADIDHFKLVNDSHGHAAGDIVLGRVGQHLKEAFYETDVAGRYGGEEFIVLLPRAQMDGVLRKAEALRKRIEADTITCGFAKLKITVSIGVARYPEQGVTGEDVIAAADRALYQAKETGRNRVIPA